MVDCSFFSPIRFAFSSSSDDDGLLFCLLFFSTLTRDCQFRQLTSLCQLTMSTADRWTVRKLWQDRGAELRGCKRRLFCLRFCCFEFVTLARNTFAIANSRAMPTNLHPKTKTHKQVYIFVFVCVCLPHFYLSGKI